MSGPGTDVKGGAPLELDRYEEVLEALYEQLAAPGRTSLEEILETLKGCGGPHADLVSSPHPLAAKAFVEEIEAARQLRRLLHRDFEVGLVEAERTYPVQVRCGRPENYGRSLGTYLSWHDGAVLHPIVDEFMRLITTRQRKPHAAVPRGKNGRHREPGVRIGDERAVERCVVESGAGGESVRFPCRCGRQHLVNYWKLAGMFETAICEGTNCVWLYD